MRGEIVKLTRDRLEQIREWAQQNPEAADDAYCYELLSEIDALREEIAQLKERLDGHKCDFDEALKSGNLLLENDRFHSRIEKLRLALQFCYDFDRSKDTEYGETVRGHKPGPGSRFLRPRDKALMCLQDDDEAAKE